MTILMIEYKHTNPSPQNKARNLPPPPPKKKKNKKKNNPTNTHTPQKSNSKTKKQTKKNPPNQQNTNQITPKSQQKHTKITKPANNVLRVSSSVNKLGIQSV